MDNEEVTTDGHTPVQESDALKIARINAERDRAINESNNEVKKHGNSLLTMLAGFFCLVFYEPICTLLGCAKSMTMSENGVTINAQEKSTLVSKPEGSSSESE